MAGIRDELRDEEQRQAISQAEAISEAIFKLLTNTIKNNIKDNPHVNSLSGYLHYIGYEYGPDYKLCPDLGVLPKQHHHEDLICPLLHQKFKKYGDVKLKIEFRSLINVERHFFRRVEVPNNEEIAIYIEVQW